jgi:hypothetical protein
MTSFAARPSGWRLFVARTPSHPRRWWHSRCRHQALQTPGQDGSPAFQRQRRLVAIECLLYPPDRLSRFVPSLCRTASSGAARGPLEHVRAGDPLSQVGATLCRQTIRAAGSVNPRSRGRDSSCKSLMYLRKSEFARITNRVTLVSLADPSPEHAEFRQTTLQASVALKVP